MPSSASRPRAATPRSRTSSTTRSPRCLCSRERRVDVMMLEVGLGGPARCREHRRCDVAVVVLHRLRSSRLARRHARGDRPREGRHLPRGRRRCSARRTCRASVFEAIARARRACRCRRSAISTGRCRSDGWSFRGEHARCSRTCRRPRLPGAIQYRNAATALAAAEALPAGAGMHLRQRRRRAARRAARRAGSRSCRDRSSGFSTSPTTSRRRACSPRTSPRGPAPGARSRSSAFSATRTLPRSAGARPVDRSLDRLHAARAARPQRCTSLRRALRCRAEKTCARGLVAAGCERRRALATPGDRVVVCGSLPRGGRGAAVASAILIARLFSMSSSPSWTPRSKRGSPARSSWSR